MACSLNWWSSGLMSASSPNLVLSGCSDELAQAWDRERITGAANHAVGEWEGGASGTDQSGSTTD